MNIVIGSAIFHSHSGNNFHQISNKVLNFIEYKCFVFLWHFMCYNWIDYAVLHKFRSLNWKWPLLAVFVYVWKMYRKFSRARVNNEQWERDGGITQYENAKQVKQQRRKKIEISFNIYFSFDFANERKNATKIRLTIQNWKSNILVESVDEKQNGKKNFFPNKVNEISFEAVKWLSNRVKFIIGFMVFRCAAMQWFVRVLFVFGMLEVEGVWFSV